MGIVDNILLAEDKTKAWIETHRFGWYMVLVFTGMALGFVSGKILLDAQTSQVLFMMIIYPIIFATVEFFLGGKGGQIK